MLPARQLLLQLNNDWLSYFCQYAIKYQQKSLQLQAFLRLDFASYAWLVIH